MKILKRYRYLFILLLVLGACNPLRGCVESKFRLDPDSRLPRWFKIPEGLTRKDVSVTLTYYTYGQVEITLLGPPPENAVLKKVVGRDRPHPLTEKRGYNQYPSYSYLKVGDIEELIERRWSGRILYVADYSIVSEANDQAVLRAELEKREKELIPVQKSCDVYFALESLSELAFAANDLRRTIKYSEQLLDWANSNADSGLVGNARNKGNVLLGRVFLRRGNIEKSKSYLIAAGTVPSSPSLSTFGPNMSLAKDLLEKGEKDIVVQYLDLVGVFWSSGREKIDKWKVEIKAGRIPDFGANLVY